MIAIPQGINPLKHKGKYPDVWSQLWQKTHTLSILKPSFSTTKEAGFFRQMPRRPSFRPSSWRVGEQGYEQHSPSDHKMWGQMSWSKFYILSLGAV